MDFAAERTRMVERLVRSRYIQDSRVRDAFLAVPREMFVRPEDANDAYADVPLPIGEAQRTPRPRLPRTSSRKLGLRPGPAYSRSGRDPGNTAPLAPTSSGRRTRCRSTRSRRLAD